jgi:hypothetical protein
MFISTFYFIVLRDHLTSVVSSPFYRRYGADALNSNVSSYAAVDAILDYIVAAINQNDNDDSRPRRFENLRDIVVIGHSA